MAQRRERGEGGLIKIHGCRFFYAQFYRQGRQIRVSTKTEVKEEAKKTLRRLMGDTERGITPENELRKVRYADLRAALLQNYVERGNKSLQTMADGSETVWGLKPLDDFFEYKPPKNGAREPEKPGLPMTQITTDAAREFARKRLDEGVSNDTVNGSLRLLRRMLNIAHEDKKIQVVPKVRLLKNSPARKGFLAQEQFDSLISFLPANLKPLVTFLYYCGVRLGEAKQIEWRQLDLKAALIRLEEDQTKNSEARTIPLPDVLVKMLAEIKPKEGTVFDTTNLRKAWCKACVAAGLGKFDEVEEKSDPRYTGLIIHDLRRSAIKNLMKAGVNEKVAMKISGHKTRTVFDRYHIVDTEDVVDAMRRVQDVVPASKGLVSDGEKIVKNARFGRRQKLLTA
jgi:integrase